jgi:hypothetical protein
MGGVRIEADHTKWNALPGKFNELSRVYNFKNLAGPGTTTSVDLRCRLSAENGRVSPFIYLIINPYLLEQTQYAAAIFGPSDKLLDYKVLTAKIEAAATGISFVVFDESDGEHILDILMLGREMTLNLVAETEPIACIPLRNDPTFRTEYEAFKASLLGTDRNVASVAESAQDKLSENEDEEDEELLEGLRAQSKERGDSFSVKCGPWHQQQVPNSMADVMRDQRRELAYRFTRMYDFSCLPPPSSISSSQEWHLFDSQKASIHLICDIEGSQMDLGRDWGSLGLRRHAIHSVHSSLLVRLWPLRLPSQMLRESLGMMSANLTMGLITDDQSRGGTANVVATPMQQDPDSLLLSPLFDNESKSKFIGAILSGKEMIFALANESQSLARLPLPNDDEFNRLYDETYDRIRRAQDASKRRIFG